MHFNSQAPFVMHIDLNSCFATIEQQANPLLRGKPTVVAAYDSPNGCILASSIEAKKYGIKTGMRVKDGKNLYPPLIVLPSDPWKYRNVHLKLRRLLSGYTNDLYPKSIDEFVLDLRGYPSLINNTMQSVAKEIKARIKSEIGDWLTVSIGISTNRYLAKVASNLQKPDGLSEINKNNFRDIFSKLLLTDLTYIKDRNAARLRAYGIYSVLDFYNADIKKLKGALHSVTGYYWYMRLRGFEIDDVIFARRTYGNSYSLPKPFSTPHELSPILAKLTTKTASRMRNAGYKAKGVHLAISYRDGSFWHKGVGFKESLFATSEIYRQIHNLLLASPYPREVRNLAVSCFNLMKCPSTQLRLFEDIAKKEFLTTSIDKINQRWGDYVITPARALRAKKNVPDRIAFGNIKELEEFSTGPK